MASAFAFAFAPRPLLTTLGLGLSLTIPTLYLTTHPPLRCDAAAPYARDAKVPVIRNGRVNPRAYRQVSAGSMLGLVCGVGVSTFSKSLALLVGLLVFGVQFLASRGFNIVPMARIQKYVKGIDVRSAIEDNVAFKLSFGATFALASLAAF